MSTSLPVIRRGAILVFFCRWQTSTAQWWEDLALFRVHAEVPPVYHIPNNFLATLHHMLGWTWYRRLAEPPLFSLPPNPFL